MNDEGIVLNNINKGNFFSLYKDGMKFEIFPKEENFYIYCSQGLETIYTKHFDSKEDLCNFLVGVFGNNIDNFVDKSKNNKLKRERIHEVDFLRGVLILLMWFDHFNYVLFGLVPMMFKIPYDSEVFHWIVDADNYWWAEWRINIRLVCLFLFLFLSGISTVLTRSNFKRGLKVTGVALIMTGGSYLITTYILQMSLSQGVFFYFGAIACLGVSALIFSFFELIIKKICKLEDSAKFIYLGLGIVFVCVGLLIGTYRGGAIWIGPDKLFEDFNWFKVPLGLAQTSDDWMPLFPYLGYFFLGAFFGEVFYKKNKTSLLSGPKPNLVKLENNSYRVGYTTYEIANSFLIKPIRRIIEFFGRNTIWVYMFHQLVNIMIIFIICWAKGYEIAI